MQWCLETTIDFEKWLNSQRGKDYAQIVARLARIQIHGHFGHIKELGDGVSELKFNNGIRVYFSVRSHQDRIVIILLGGNKNGQDKDIKKAKGLLHK
jgi:putative addiction module killer protein